MSANGGIYSARSLRAGIQNFRFSGPKSGLPVYNFTVFASFTVIRHLEMAFKAANPQNFAIFP